MTAQENQIDFLTQRVAALEKELNKSEIENKELKTKLEKWKEKY